MLLVRSLAPFALIALASSLAAANPVTAGVGLGMTQSEADANANTDSSHTLGLFGRLGLNKRVSAQLEVARITTADDNLSLRTATGLLVIDLGTSGRLVPILLAGAGLDWSSDQWGDTTDAHHFEGGLGLEYRADGGVTLGADLRIGGRSIDDQTTKAYPLSNADCNCSFLYQPTGELQAGEYRAARLYAGIRF